MAEFPCGNLFVRTNPLANTGDKVDGHKHNFDHMTIVFKGTINVKAVLPSGEKINQDYTAPDFFLVKRDVEHEITALAPDTEFWCVFARDAKDNAEAYQ